MPNIQNPKLAIHLDLLKPQSNPEKIFEKLIHWLLSTGRYIFIFVEAIVLIALAARFKLDLDLSDKRIAIESRINYIEGLKHDEDLIRRTQLKLSTLDTFETNYADYSKILKAVADQTPAGIKITALSIDNADNNLTILVSGEAQNNNDVAAFLEGLKTNHLFNGAAITDVGLDKNILDFSLSANVDINILGGKNQ